MLAFEADELHRIVDLMRALRAAAARRHTREEVPFYTGRRRELARHPRPLVAPSRRGPAYPRDTCGKPACPGASCSLGTSRRASGAGARVIEGQASAAGSRVSETELMQ